MPNRALNNNDNFNSLITWVTDNLNGIPPFTPHQDLIANIPESRGIYFWFMQLDDDCAVLNNYVTITPINPRITKEINGVMYNLVYIGTAGTGKKGKSHLQERLDWHIKQHHKEGSICSGTLSTLRAGLGALLSNDLILHNTEVLVNEVMEKYMKVYWLEYEVKHIIDSDEKVLIKTIKPLLNIKNNPNARANAAINSTKIYKERRIKIYQDTRDRLGCGKENDLVQRNNQPDVNTPLYNHQILSDDGNCVEYFVTQDQDISVVTRGIEDLYRGEVRIKIFNSQNHNQIFDLWQFNTTGNDLDFNAQNIYRYFANTCPERLHHLPPFSRYRNVVIKHWMIENNIEEITVRVCKENIQ